MMSCYGALPQLSVCQSTHTSCQTQTDCHTCSTPQGIDYHLHKHSLTCVQVKVPKDVEQSAAAVAQLTRLQSLSLQDCLQAKEECLTVNEVLPALSGLKQLTGDIDRR